MVRPEKEPIDERDRFYLGQFDAIKSLMDERDRLYISQFKASDVAVAAALANSEKAVNAAFLSSEKAVLKAEEAQKEYNERSNEFRGQLDDQAKTLMPRTEVLTMFKAVEDKINRMDLVSDSRLLAIAQTSKNDLMAFQTSYKSGHDSMVNDVTIMREELARAGGKDKGIGLSWGVLLAAAALIASLLWIWSFTTRQATPTAPPQVIYAVPPK